MCQRRWGRPGRRSHGRPRPLEAVAPHALRIRRFRARTWSASGVAWYVTGQLAQSSVSGPSRNGRGTLVEGFPTRAELGTATAQLELVQSLDGGRRPARQSTATWNHFAGGGIQPRGSRSEGNTAVSGGGAAMKVPSHLAPRRHTAGAAVTTNFATGHNAGSRPSPSEETPSSGQPLPCTAEGRLLRAFVQKSVRLDMTSWRLNARAGLATHWSNGCDSYCARSGMTWNGSGAARCHMCGPMTNEDCPLWVQPGRRWTSS
jgi:hypothetical protein